LIELTLPDGTAFDSSHSFLAGGAHVRAVNASITLPNGLPDGFAAQLVAILRAASTGALLVISTYPITVDHTPPVLDALSTVRTDSSLTVTASLSDTTSGVAAVSVQPSVNGTSTASSALPLISGDGFSPTTYGATLAGIDRLDVVGLDLTASDSKANSMLATGMPVANSGGSRQVACDSPTGAVVVLDGSLSTGVNLSYLWSGPFGAASGVTTVEPLPFGANSVTLTLADGRGYTGTQTSVVTVGDTEPPSLTAQATPSCLWPPNNKLVALSLSDGIQAAASDVCDPDPTVRIASVTSSDGTPVSFNGERTCVRARKGITYTITVEASDNSGNTTLAQTTVVVPNSSTTGCATPVLKDDDPACAF
jgi:hypothetical protein